MKNKISLILLGLFTTFGVLGVNVSNKSIQQVSASEITNTTSDWSCQRYISAESATGGVKFTSQNIGLDATPYANKNDLCVLDGLEFTITSSNAGDNCTRKPYGFFFTNPSNPVSIYDSTSMTLSVWPKMYGEGTTQTRFLFQRTHDYSAGDNLAFTDEACTSRAASPAGSTVANLNFNGATFKFSKCSNGNYNCKITPTTAGSVWTNNAGWNAGGFLNYYLAASELPLSSGKVRLNVFAVEAIDTSITNFKKNPTTASSISINYGSDYLFGTSTISATVSETTTSTVSWSSSNSSIVSVSSTGQFSASLTANQMGSATITASIAKSNGEVIYNQKSVYSNPATSEYIQTKEKQAGQNNLLTNNWDGNGHNLFFGKYGAAYKKTKVTLDGFQFLYIQNPYTNIPVTHSYFYFKNSTTADTNIHAASGKARFTVEHGYVAGAVETQSRLYITDKVFQNSNNTTFVPITAQTAGGELKPLSNGDAIIFDKLSSREFYYFYFKRAKIGWWEITVKDGHDGDGTKHMWGSNNGWVQTGTDGYHTYTFYVPDSYFDLDNNGQTYLHVGSSYDTNAGGTTNDNTEIRLCNLADGTQRKYTVTLNNQSATTAGTTTIYTKYAEAFYSDVARQNVITSITCPTKTHYTFDGYWTGNGSGTIAIGNNGVITATADQVPSDTTYYAKWAPNTYTLSASTTDKFSVNFYSDSECTVSISTASYGSTFYYKLTAIGGYNYSNYQTKTGSLTLNETNWSYNETNLTATYEAFDNPTANTYYLHYDANKPSNALENVTGMPSSDQTCTYDQNVTLESAPSLSGFSFLGWYKGTTSESEKVGDANQILTTPNFTTTINGTYTIYANWECGESYAITYATTFNTEICAICKTDGSTDVATLKAKWNGDMKASYNALDSYKKYWLEPNISTNQNIKDFLAKYDYVYRKYSSQGLEDFLDIFNDATGAPIVYPSTEKVNLTIPFATLGACVVGSLIFVFIKRRKKEIED